MTLLLAILALFSFPFAQLAHADDQAPSQEVEHHHHRHARWALAFSPRYYGLNTNGYSGAFTGNGFTGPKSGTVGSDFTLYWMTRTNWQLGFGFGGVGYSTDNGSSEASYSQGFFGFWVGKTLPLCDDWELTLGGLFAGGDAQLEVLSSSANGKTNESSFILEPKIIAAYQAAPWFKIGVSGSYLEPLAQSDTIRGNTLTTSNISLHGASAGVEFIFGRFWTDQKPD